MPVPVPGPVPVPHRTVRSFGFIMGGTEAEQALRLLGGRHRTIGGRCVNWIGREIGPT